MAHYHFEEQSISDSTKSYQAVYLYDNIKPFPPDYYVREENLLKSFCHNLLSQEDNVTPECTDIPLEENVSSEDDFIDGLDLFIQFRDADIKYEYRNDIRFFYPCDNRYSLERLFINDVEIKNGKITFILDDGTPLIVEDRFLMNTFRTDNEESFPNTYKSFFGKKSILKHHFKHVYPTNYSYYWSNEVASYETNDIIECIHDGVTSFIIIDHGIYEDDFTSITFPDGVYDLDGVKIADNTMEEYYNNDVDDIDN